MLSFLVRFFPVLIFWGVFLYVIFFVEYPKSLASASPFQLLAFFIPLFLALTFTINLLLKYLPSSVFISFGLILMLLLQGLDSLNIVTGLITAVAVVLALSYLKKIKKNRSSKPKTGKVITFPKKKPKLTKPL